MEIIIQSHHRTIPELHDMLLDYALDGGKILRTGGDDRTLPFDPEGELEFLQKDYDDLSLFDDIRIEKALLFRIFTLLELETLVPKTYPEPLDEDGNYLTYGQYFRNKSDGFDYPIEQSDGTFLVRIARPILELTDADRRIFQADLGGILVLSKGEELKQAAAVEI